MVQGLDIFRKNFKKYENQYVLIGGTACDIAFESNDTSFRATRDLDLVLILFKAKAYLDLKQRKENNEKVDLNDIKKHKKDVLRIAAELMLERVKELPFSVKSDIDTFIASLVNEPFDDNSLKNYGLKNEEIIEVLQKIFD